MIASYQIQRYYCGLLSPHTSSQTRKQYLKSSAGIMLRNFSLGYQQLVSRLTHTLGPFYLFSLYHEKQDKN